MAAVGSSTGAGAGAGADSVIVGVNVGVGSSAALFGEATSCSVVAREATGARRGVRTSERSPRLMPLGPPFAINSTADTACVRGARTVDAICRSRSRSAVIPSGPVRASFRVFFSTTYIRRDNVRNPV